MPLKLVPPRAGRSSNWTVEGSYLGCRLRRSTGTPDQRVARQMLAKWKAEIERGELAQAGELTFARAAAAYLDAGGPARFLAPIVKHFGPTKLARAISQADIDFCAVALYPSATPATRNRQVYSPISAILRHNGVRIDLRRPRGAEGETRTDWLKPDQAARAIKAAAEIDAELGALLTLLLYTGLRRGEALGLTWSAIDLGAATAIIPKTKNGKPRIVHLPPAAVAALASLARTNRPTVFRWAQPRGLYRLLDRVEKACGLSLGLHLFRHTWATWMRSYARMTPEELARTGAWASAKSLRRYDHVEALEVSRAADRLPDVSAKNLTDRKVRGATKL